MVFGHEISLVDILIRDKGILEEFVEILNPDRDVPASVLSIVLGTLLSIFMKEKAMNQKDYYVIFERLGGIDEIEILQGHKNPEIYNLCADILKEFGDACEVTNINFIENVNQNNNNNQNTVQNS